MHIIANTDWIIAIYSVISHLPFVHDSPFHPSVHVHVLGDEQVPPFLQLGEQTAAELHIVIEP